MQTRNDIENKLRDAVQHANAIAGQLLFYHPAGFTPEDIVQDYIVKLLMKGGSSQELVEQLGSHTLRKALKNKMIDLLRSQSATKRGGNKFQIPYDQVDYFCQTFFDNPEFLLVEKETNAEIKKAIREANLSKTQSEILKKDSEGWTSEEIAENLQIDVDTVYSRRSEAYRKVVKIAKRLIKK